MAFEKWRRAAAFAGLLGAISPGAADAQNKSRESSVRIDQGEKSTPVCDNGSCTIKIERKADRSSILLYLKDLLKQCERFQQASIVSNEDWALMVDDLRAELADIKKLNPDQFAKDPVLRRLEGQVRIALDKSPSQSKLSASKTIIR